MACRSCLGLDESFGWRGAGHGADEMFSRETDRHVERTLAKRPLEVGANLIARTAHSANQFLQGLRSATSCEVPLLRSPAELRDVGVIEVYPAATRIAAKGQSVATLLRLEEAELSCPNSHVEDALWCVVAALHFLRGECDVPADHVTSRREGWIWFRRHLSGE